MRRTHYHLPYYGRTNAACLIVPIGKYDYMARGKLTQKYQVTIPKEIREKVHVAPGEVIAIEAVSPDEILLKRFPSVSDPLDVLIGKKQFKRHVPVEELEEKIESR